MTDVGMVAVGDDVESKGRVTHLFHWKSLFSALNVTRENFAVVTDFIAFLNNDPSVARPIGNIFLGAHAAEDGTVTIQMIPKQPKERGKYQSDYETLEKTENAATLLIEPATIGPNPAQHFFHFKGCNIGRAVVFLEKWKAVMGNQIQLSAPRFNHGIFDDGIRGVWEFMMYEFVVTSPTPIKDRDTLIQRFKDKKFTYVETIVGPGLQTGPAIPDSVWDGWLPKNLAMKNNAIKSKTEYPKTSTFTVQEAAPPLATLSLNEQFEVRRRTFQKTIRNLNPVPTSQADRLAALRAFFLADDENFLSRYDVAKMHPFPMYTRFGYATFDDFMAGFTWVFSHENGSSDLFVTGVRHEYAQFIALTEPNPGVPTTNSQLLTNFHPTNSSNQPAEQLAITDLRFFKIV